MTRSRLRRLSEPEVLTAGAHFGPDGGGDLGRRGGGPVRALLAHGCDHVGDRQQSLRLPQVPGAVKT
jgi:hypothetical protein